MWSCTKPFVQTRDAAQWEVEEVCADFIWKKLMLQELKKGFTSSIKMEFMSLRNESTWRVISVEGFHGEYLLVLCILMWIICLIPSTYIGRHSPASGPAVLQWGADVAVCHLSICQGLTQKSGHWYTSSIWPYAGRTKITYLQYTLWMKNQLGSMRKKL